jgi:hypothetical protein
VASGSALFVEDGYLGLLWLVFSGVEAANQFFVHEPLDSGVRLSVSSIFTPFKPPH